FAKHHQKHEEEDAPSCSAPTSGGVRLQFLLNLFLQVARNAVHPNDHRNHEERGEEQQKPLETVLIDAVMVENQGYGQAKSGGQGDARPHKSGEMSTTRAGEVDQDNADDQSGLDTFAEGDEKGRKH